ncbi:putative esterase [Caulobacter rhizosphaerae]|nr:putative esterase [Caulobacter rhizosphaerae]
MMSAASVAALAVAACQARSSSDPSQATELTASEAARCQGLTGQRLGGATVEAAQAQKKGFKIGKGLSRKAPTAFCHVQATGSSGPGSKIRIEIFLPPHWNGKLFGVGGGGLSGGLSGSSAFIAPELARGYAGVANDAGHQDDKSVAWALNAPAIEDFGFKANHQALLAAKAVMAAYYGRPADRSYFFGCSNGGRDALMLAQRWPTDYDGIVAGAPAADWTRLTSTFLFNHRLLEETPGAEKLGSKFELIREAAVRQCDTLDGVADGVLENPLACRFDPAQLQCKDGDKTSKCLTPGEVQVVRAFYQGPRSKDGQSVYPGYPPGSEYGKSIIPIQGWGNWNVKGPQAGFALSKAYYSAMVAGDLGWNPASFDLDRDYPKARQKTGAALDADNPDLRPFADHGGKLILFHGWEDPAIPAQATINYYSAVSERTGAQADTSVRLFMAPGMSHCMFGHGPDVFDPVAAIDGWVSSGKPPETIIASKMSSNIAQALGRPTKTVRTRPLCAWPKVAHYNGTGSTDEARNFTCVAPTPPSA